MWNAREVRNWRFWRSNILAVALIAIGLGGIAKGIGSDFAGQPWIGLAAIIGGGIMLFAAWRQEERESRSPAATLPAPSAFGLHVDLAPHAPINETNRNGRDDPPPPPGGPPRLAGVAGAGNDPLAIPAQVSVDAADGGPRDRGRWRTLWAMLSVRGWTIRNAQTRPDLVELLQLAKYVRTQAIVVCTFGLLIVAGSVVYFFYAVFSDSNRLGDSFFVYAVAVVAGFVSVRCIEIVRTGHAAPTLSPRTSDPASVPSSPDY